VSRPSPAPDGTAPDGTAPGADRSARRAGDEVPPPGGGVFRRLGPATGSFGAVFTAVEGVFAPAARDAREELQRQKRIGQRDPADTDPPADHDGEEAPRVVVPGRPGTPFSGSILIRHPPPAPPR
jgi:hypothetical protein